jgi:hypothetical protein
MNARLKREGQAGRQEYQTKYDEQWMLPSGKRSLRSYRRSAETATSRCGHGERAEYYGESELNGNVIYVNRFIYEQPDEKEARAEAKPYFHSKTEP